MIEDLVEFLQHAVRLEEEAAEGYTRLAEARRRCGDTELTALFDRFATFSRRHRETARARLALALAGRPAPQPFEFRWPDGVSPENPLAVLDRPDLDARMALDGALALERQACDFYSAVAGQTRSELVQELAQEFAEEEAEHVDHLQRWIARLP